MSLAGRPSAIHPRPRRQPSAIRGRDLGGKIGKPALVSPRTRLRELVLARDGATVEAGCPTPLPAGHHWFCMPTSSAEQLYVRAADDLWTPEELEVGRCVHALGTLHLVDPSTRSDAGPDISELMTALNFGFLVAVAEGRAVGYLILGDEDADGRYEYLVNVWTATGLRRTGVARHLLERARADHPIAKLQPPITPMGRAWIRAAAPELL